jgi:hypothetical protein
MVLNLLIIEWSRVAGLQAKGLASSPVGFYDLLQNRITIHFKSKEVVAAGHPEFDLKLNKKMTYEMVSHIPSNIDLG